MPLSNESLLTHIMKIKDLLFELDRDKESSITEVREIALKLQSELVGLSAVLDGLRKDVSRIEDAELKKFSSLIHKLAQRVAKLEQDMAVEAAKDEVGADKAAVELKKADQDNKHELRMKLIQILGSGGAGAALVKLMDWITG